MLTVPIKSLYFESGSKHLEPGEKTTAVCMAVVCLQMVVIQPILTIFA